MRRDPLRRGPFETGPFAARFRAQLLSVSIEVGKSIVIENLDFRQKKAALDGEPRKYRWMLSSFRYGKIKATRF